MNARAFAAWCVRWPWQALATLLGTIICIGALLDTWSNATNLVTPAMSYAGISMAIVGLAVWLWLRRKHASHAIRAKAVLIASGTVVVFLMPRAADFLRAEKPPAKTGAPDRAVSQTVTAPRPRVHLLMVDVSASLRDSRTRDVVASYIRNTNNKVRIGLGTFGRTFRLLMTPRVLPTSVYLDQLDGHPSANCTHIYESMLDAGRYLNRYDRETRRLVLFTDGNEFRCSDARPRDWTFERDFRGCELEIVLLGDANKAEMERLFPNAQFTLPSF